MAASFITKHPRALDSRIKPVWSLFSCRLTILFVWEGLVFGVKLVFASTKTMTKMTNMQVMSQSTRATAASHTAWLATCTQERATNGRRRSEPRHFAFTPTDRVFVVGQCIDHSCLPRILFYSASFLLRTGLRNDVPPRRALLHSV